MHDLPILILQDCLFLALVAAAEHYFKRSIIPPVCWILLLGTGYGLAQSAGHLSLPKIRLEPEVVLFVFLPLLIFNSSRKLNVRALLAEAPGAATFAIGGVLAGMFLLGLPFSWITGVPFRDALLFGAILSATDPVAVAAVFSRSRMPEKLRTLIEGESLLNDGVVVILFSVMSAIVLDGGSVSARDTALKFLWAMCGALGFGVAAGFCVSWILKKWHEIHGRFVGGLMPLVAAYAVFAVAEHFLHFSGVISVMAAAITMTSNRYRPGCGDDGDRFFDRFWEFLDELTNNILFFILGVATGAHYYFFPFGWIPLLILALLVARGIVIYGGSALLRAFRVYLPMSWQHAINIAGLRGALAIALILLLPENYPHREAFLCAAFVMIVFTMMVNTVAMQWYLSRKPFE